MIVVWVALLGILSPVNALAAIPSKGKANPLGDRLVRVRGERVRLEQGLIDSLKANRQAKENLKKIQKLIALQKEERGLGQTRIRELEETVRELESRRGVIRERVTVERVSIRKSLRELMSVSDSLPDSRAAIEREADEQARAHLVRRMVQLGVREIDALRADLEDADRLETRIAAEKGELEAMVNEMAESEGILELNRQLQLDLIKRNWEERVAQLERWKSLKKAEARVSDLIHQFNARMEIQEASRSEREAEKALALSADSAFARSKGRLPLPVKGKVVAQFGKAHDSVSGLTIFKKGIEIDAGKSKEVRSISSGKVAFAGELPNYGQTTIVDHGDHFYSILAHLGSLRKSVGDAVEAGEEIGISDSSGSPVYFEIRARNIPVNPMQWIAASP